MSNRIINIQKNINIGDKKNFTIIAGPCVIENEETVFQIADTMNMLSKKLGFNYIFKASFDKANRSSIDSYRGPGIDKGLKILERVKNKYKLPIITDIHEPWQANEVKSIVDIIQIPAFLCRQTDLLVSAAKTNKVINIKKAQFLSPEDMKNVTEKITKSGNKKIMLTERGTFFGYNNLVVDMRSILIMKQLGYPIIFDATHSVQKPGAKGKTSGGDREYVFPLMKAATSLGIDGLFLEVHPDPEKALSDGANMVYLKDVEKYIKKILQINNIINVKEDSK